MPSDRIDPPLDSTRAVRLLRAKAGELERWVKDGVPYEPDAALAYLAADIALIATLTADAVERANRE